MKCSCDSYSLFHFGCRCGAFEHENIGHVWFNGIIYCIGRTAEEAKIEVSEELSAYPDFTLQWIEGDGEGWRLIDDDEPLTLDFSAAKETKFARDWVKMYGSGFLAAA